MIHHSLLQCFRTKKEIGGYSNETGNKKEGGIIRILLVLRGAGIVVPFRNPLLVAVDQLSQVGGLLCALDKAVLEELLGGGALLFG